MRKVMVVIVAAAALAACGPKSSPANNKIEVVASFYPVAFAAQQIGGDRVHVRNLTPAGVEPHDLELTSKDVDAVDAADLVLYIGGGFQPAVRDAAKRNPHAVDVAQGLLDAKDDPHFWLDPTIMGRAAMTVAHALLKVDPAHRRTYAANAGDLVGKLAGLDTEFQSGMATCARHDLVTTHAGFGYLADRYHLVQDAITGLSPDSEPDPQRLAHLADLVRRTGTTTVFAEENIPPRFANTLARETGAKVGVLSPLESLTKREQSRGDDYFSVMRRNLAALRLALGCS